MAAFRLFLISFVSLLFLHGCIAMSSSSGLQDQQECNFNRLNALQPTSTLESEGGKTEFWNPDTKEFRCSGVAFARHTLRRKGLFVPSYVNSVLMAFVEQGRGFFGVVLPGCPETFQSPQEQSGEKMRDRHQKVQNFKKGDLLVFHAGVTHWLYNSGDQDVRIVVMFDTTNTVNQLDNIPQRFFIFGNPRGQQQQGQGQQGQELIQQFQGDSILRGFDLKSLVDGFKIPQELASRLKGQNVKEGHIITVEKELQVEIPEKQQEQEQEKEQEQEESRRREGQGQGKGNGLEETSCSQNIRINLDKFDQADVYNPQAGYLRSVNSHDVPLLDEFKLSAERGFLKKNAMLLPHWVLNAHTIIYTTDGEARIQIVNNLGKQVFDERAQKGQLVMVPQNFAVMIQAGNQGFRWVSFKTNDNAMMTPIAGRNSVLRGLPLGVVANVLGVPEEQAANVKFNNAETILSVPQQPSQGKRFSNVYEKLLIRAV